MNKIFTQNMDWHITEKQTGKYLGEVFVDDNETQIWIKNPADTPNFLKQQLEFGFAKINDSGYIVITTNDYENITEYDYV